MGKLVISKLDSAKRQLETAIKLYFNFDDPVSLHTLTAAAYNVLRNINKKRGNDSVLIKEWLVENMVKSEKQKEFQQMINQAENFFKHADRDHEGTYTFNPKQTEYLLWDAVKIYQQLTGEMTPLFYLFRCWFIMHNLHIFDKMPEKDKMNIQSFAYTPADRVKYFSDMLPVAHKTVIG